MIVDIVTCFEKIVWGHINLKWESLMSSPVHDSVWVHLPLTMDKNNYSAVPSKKTFFAHGSKSYSWK